MKEWLASLPPIPVSTILLVLLLSVLLGYLGFLAWRSWKRLDGLELKDRFAARTEFIKTTAQILGGAFFLFGLYFTWANVVATQEKNVTDLYVKAIEQLGSDKLEVRLGGIYALERIARDSEKDHWTIMEVLTAYVRENAPWPPEKIEIAKKKRPWAKARDKEILLLEPPESDIKAVLNVLARTAIIYALKGEKRRIDLTGTNLSGVELPEANLEKAVFEESNLRGSNFLAANLGGAIFYKCNLQDAHFVKANLQRAVFEKANLQGAKLSLANLKEANLKECNLRGATLWYSDFTGANLQKANLQGANLQGAETDAHFCIYMGAKGLTYEQVADAIWDETTRWPLGFSPPAPRRDEKKEGK